MKYLSLSLVFVASFLIQAEAWPQTLFEKEEIAYNFVGAITRIPWKLAKTSWDEYEEANYSRYISQIGEGVDKGLCGTVADCLRNPKVNPYASSDPKGLKLYADCADFPYFLRAYYAWRNHLPFGFISKISPIQPEGTPSRDVRYSPYGNIVRERYSVTVKKRLLGLYDHPNAIEIFNKTLPSRISSGNFRVSYQGMDQEDLYSDFYPIQITRQAVKPGTVIYDPNGHVVTVYKVTKEGRVYFIDAHPDNSMTTGIYNSRFVRSYPGQGAGFKNWRPLYLENAQWSRKGGYYGGKIKGVKDRALPLFSTEQYYGTTANPDWKLAEYQFQGKKMDYYEWVRHRLADGPFVENPVDEVKIMTQELCKDMQERAAAVQVAVTANIHLQPHPERLPQNIYGASGSWETYATPARDARLKVGFRELRVYVEEVLRNPRNRRASSAADLLKAYSQRALACKITYKNSAGAPVSFHLEQARDRIYDLSFDPYHCIERRWGAQGAELRTCREDPVKRAWYEREKWMRFQHDRNTSAYTGYSLEELTGPMPGAGVSEGQDLDVIAFLSKNK